MAVDTTAIPGPSDGIADHRTAWRRVIFNELVGDDQRLSTASVPLNGFYSLSAAMLDARPPSCDVTAALRDVSVAFPPDRSRDLGRLLTTVCRLCRCQSGHRSPVHFLRQ